MIYPTLLRSVPKRLPQQLLSNNRRLHYTIAPAPAGALPVRALNPSIAAPEARYSYTQRALSPFAEVFRSYGRAQRRRPWLTQILTAVGVYTLGDYSAQTYFGSEDGSYDLVRTGRMTLVGAAFAVPWFEWYAYLASRFTSLPRALAIAMRVGVNQIVFTPPFLACFFALQGVLAGLSAAEIKQKVTVAAPRAFFDGAKLWPAVSAINFWLVPFEYRALFGGVISVGWNCYLSWLNSRADAIVEEEEHTVAVEKAMAVRRFERFQMDERLKIAV